MLIAVCSLLNTALTAFANSSIFKSFTPLAKILLAMFIPNA